MNQSRRNRRPSGTARRDSGAALHGFNAKAQRPRRHHSHYSASFRPLRLCVLREWTSAAPTMNRSHKGSSRPSRRRGLTPLEMVLAIPILLFVVGLTVIFGVVTCWKVRGQLACRDAVWSTRHPRWGTGVPTPLEWAAPATRRWRPGGAVAALEHQAFQHPVIRGPLPNNLQVNPQLFNPTQELRIGEAQTSRTPPTLARLGQYSLNLAQPILDGKWQYHQMGLGSNTSRRIPHLYPDIPDPPQVQTLQMRYQQAIQAIVSSPLQPALAVLDRDQEIYAWYYTYHDFHARFPSFCELDTQAVRRAHMPGHL